MAEKKNNENDLDDLLNDALGDFDKPLPATVDNGTLKAESSEEAPKKTESLPADKEDQDEFFTEQAKLLAGRMNTLFGGLDTPSGDIPPLPQDPDKILSGFKKMAEAAAVTLQGENPSNDEEVAKFSESIAEALRGLNEGVENFNAPVSENDIVSMFGNIGLDGGGDSEGNMFLPFMEGMMQSLLSAEILLPSINELIDKYPKYLATNVEKISIIDKERYEKQLELYKVIKGHLELESPNDNATVKREKFRVVLDDLQKLQEFGQPPEEIIAETTMDLPMLDPSAAAGAANPQCPTM